MICGKATPETAQRGGREDLGPRARPARRGPGQAGGGGGPRGTRPALRAPGLGRAGRAGPAPAGDTRRGAARGGAAPIAERVEDAARLHRIQSELAMGFRALARVGPRCRCSARRGRRATTPSTRLRAAADAPGSARRASRSSPAAARAHGGGEPGRPRQRGALDRPQHRAALRGGDQPVRRPPAEVPLLLHAQGHVRPLRQLVRGLSRRLRHARRAVRGARP